MSYTITSKSSTLTTNQQNLTEEQLRRIEENKKKALMLKNSNNNSSASSTTNISLTNEQLKRIEENRKKALMLKQKQDSGAVSGGTKIHTLDSINVLSNQSNSNATDSSAKGADSLIGKCVPLEEDPENRFEIIIGYNKGLIDLFKTMSSRKYDPNTKRWNFSIRQYDEIICRTKIHFNNTIKLEPLEKSAGKSSLAKFFLIDANRFEVVCDFNQNLNDIFKTIKSKSYDPTLKKWSFDLKDYDELVASISAKLKGTVSVVPLPKVVKEIFKDKIANKPAEDQTCIDFNHLKANIDSTITKSLLPFQVESICFAIKQQGRLLLADDMGEYFNR